MEFRFYFFTINIFIFHLAVKKSWETLNSEKDKEECLGTVEDARARLEEKLKQKRKKLKKEGKPTAIPEDDPYYVS